MKNNIITGAPQIIKEKIWERSYMHSTFGRVQELDFCDASEKLRSTCGAGICFSLTQESLKETSLRERSSRNI